MESRPLPLDENATGQLRRAAATIARHVAEPARMVILRELGRVLESGREHRACTRCGGDFSFDLAFYEAEGLSPPRRCFACRTLMRGR